MVAPADHPRRVLHYQAALVRDQDGVTARCLELGWLCAHGRDIDEALARLCDLVEMELSHRSDHPWPLYAMVVPLDVPVPHPAAMTQQPGVPQYLVGNLRGSAVFGGGVQE